MNQQAIDSELKKILQGNYSCSRVWEAWQYGTMTQDDFSNLEEDENIYNDIKALFEKKENNSGAIDILDEMIGNRIQSTSVQEGRHEDILHNADMRYEINILKESKSRIQALGDGWIPVTERLPNSCINCIIWHCDGMSVGAQDGGIWYDEYLKTPYGVTHWTPLPDSPKQ